MSKVKTYRFSELTEPKTVEEFRSNLKKFYIKGCMGEVVTSGCNTSGIDIDKTNTMLDYYNDQRLQITPTVVQVGSWDDYVHNNMDLLYNHGIEHMIKTWWENDDNNIIVDGSHPDSFSFQMELNEKYQNGQMYWKKYWDEQDLMTEFWKKTLGEFSGYGSYEPIQDTLTVGKLIDSLEVV